MTHSAFFITLCEHGDGAGSCFPDHPPEVSHCAWQRTLGGYELIWTQVALEKKREKQMELVSIFHSLSLSIHLPSCLPAS